MSYQFLENLILPFSVPVPVSVLYRAQAIEAVIKSHTETVYRFILKYYPMHAGEKRIPRETRKPSARPVTKGLIQLFIQGDTIVAKLPERH